MKIYKPTQGKTTRIVTAVSATVIGAWGCYKLIAQLGSLKIDAYVQYGVPAALLVLLAGLMFWLVNRPQTADFLIATEAEMKKVSWSSRKEVVGSTKVVIITTFILAAILFLVDVLFANLFQLIGVTG
jgi:preprotein translocase subunit SecE